MAKPGRHIGHFDGVGMEGATLPRIGYDPEPPLDIDTSPIDGDDLRAWRERQYSESGRNQYPSQTEIAEGFDVSRRTWGKWERNTMPAANAALFREWAVFGREVDVDRSPIDPGYARAIVAMLGSMSAMADGTGVPKNTVMDWSKQNGNSPGRRYAALVRWICQDLDLEPLDDLPDRLRGGAGRLSAREVREIRQRVKGGESQRSVADDFRVSQKLVFSVVHREAYQWVE